MRKDLRHRISIVASALEKVDRQRTTADAVADEAAAALRERQEYYKKLKLKQLLNKKKQDDANTQRLLDDMRGGPKTPETPKTPAAGERPSRKLVTDLAGGAPLLPNGPGKYVLDKLKTVPPTKAEAKYKNTMRKDLKKRIDVVAKALELVANDSTLSGNNPATALLFAVERLDLYLPMLHNTLEELSVICNQLNVPDVLLGNIEQGLFHVQKLLGHLSDELGECNKAFASMKKKAGSGKPVGGSDTGAESPESPESPEDAEV